MAMMATALVRKRTMLSRTVHGLVLTLLLIFGLIPGPAPLAYVALGLAVPLIMWEIFKSLPSIHPVIRCVVPTFSVLAFAAVIVPPALGYGHDKLARLVTLTMLSALAAALIRDRHDLRSFVAIWTALGCLLAVLTLMGDSRNGRALGFDANPIWLARAMASALVGLLWLAGQRIVSWWLAAPATALLVWGVYSTGSRGPAVAALCGIAILLAVGNVNRVPRLVTAGGAIAGAMIAWFALAAPFDTASRLEQFLVHPASEWQMSLRPNLLGRTLPVIAEHPLGVGYGNWASYTGGWPFRYPHNLLAEVTTEAGWLAGGVLVLMVVIGVRRLAKASDRDPAARLVLALLAVEIVSVSVSGDVNARTFFAFLALGYVVGSWQDQRNAQPASLGWSAEADTDAGFKTRRVPHTPVEPGRRRSASRSPSWSRAPS